MKYNLIVENQFDFALGKYYLIIKDNQQIDCFICNNFESCAKHYNFYVVQNGCQIWQYKTKAEAAEIVKKLYEERDFIYQKFAVGTRSAAANLAKCCELATIANAIKKVFSEKTKVEAQK